MLLRLQCLLSAKGQGKDVTVCCSRHPVWELHRQPKGIRERKCVRHYCMLKARKRNISMVNRTLTPNATSTNSCAAAKALRVN